MGTFQVFYRTSKSKCVIKVRTASVGIGNPILKVKKVPANLHLPRLPTKAVMTFFMNIECLSAEHCKYFLPKFPLCPQNSKTTNCTMGKVPCDDSRMTSCSGLTSRPIQIEPYFCQQYYFRGNTTFVSYVKPLRLHTSSITKAIIGDRSRYTL